MTGRPAKYSCEFKNVSLFSVMVQGQLPNNFALTHGCAKFLSIRGHLGRGWLSLVSREI